MYKGEMMNPGVYVYVLEITFIHERVGNQYNGSVRLIR